MDKMKRQKTLLAIVGTTVAAIILFPVFIGIVGGYFSTHQKRVPVPSHNPLSVSTEEKWLTFTTEKYKVLYPPEMYQSEKPIEGYTVTFLFSNLRGFDIPVEIQPRIQIYASELPIAEFLEETNKARNKEQFAEFAKIELNDYEVYQTKALDPEVIFTHTIIGDDKESYLIELFTIEKENDVLKNTYDKMISSFEMLKNE